jgi:hypothetical protein
VKELTEGSEGKSPSFWWRRGAAISVTVFLLAQMAAGASLLPWYLAWLGLLIIQAVFFKRARLLLFLIIGLTLYASTAWVALVYEGLNFDPWPSRGIVEAVSRGDLRSVAWAYLVTEIIVGAEFVGHSVQQAAASMRASMRRAGSKVPDLLAGAFLGAVGLADLYRVLRLGLGNVLGGARREYATELLLGGNHNIQLVVVAATVYLVSRIGLGWAKGAAAAAVVLAWTPFVLVGSRKELILAAAICLTVIGGQLGRVRRSTVLVGGIFAFLLPAFSTGDIFHSFHEFILPQYMHFSVAMNLVPADLGGSFWDRAWFLVPSPVRLVEITDFGRAFFQLRVTGVGLGASPFGEAELNAFLGSTTFSFVSLYVFALLLMVAARRRFPVFTLVSYGLLLVYGRSDFWTYMFFAAYISLLISLVVWAFRLPRSEVQSGEVPDRLSGFAVAKSEAPGRVG